MLPFVFFLGKIPERTMVLRSPAYPSELGWQERVVTLWKVAGVEVMRPLLQMPVPILVEAVVVFRFRRFVSAGV